MGETEKYNRLFFEEQDEILQQMRDYRMVSKHKKAKLTNYNYITPLLLLTKGIEDCHHQTLAEPSRIV